MKIGLGIGIPFIRNYVSSIVFDPSKLFTGSTNGAWYDPSDTTTLFRDAAGTQPVTAVEQPVGLMLDKSKGLVLGPELVTNGTFDTDTTGWTPQATVIASRDTSIFPSGALKLQVTSATSTYVEQSLGSNFVPGRKYKATATVYTSSTTQAGAGAAISFVNNSFASTSSVTQSQKDTAQTLTIYFTATKTTHSIYLAICTLDFMAWGSVGSVAYFDNISVRELPGNHAFNSSGNSANFPVLSARVNLLTKSEQFDDAVWTDISGLARANVSANSSVAPDGTLTADTITAVDTGGAKAQSISVVANTEYRISISAKIGNVNWVRYRLSDGTTVVSVYFNIVTGSVGSISTASGAWTSLSSLTPELQPNGFYRLTAIFKLSSAATVSFAPIPATADLGNSAVGSAGIFWGADLRVANDALSQPSYQRVNTSTDYDTVGFKPYLRFNGTNQWLQTNSINFSATDKMFVSAGVRKLSDATVGIVAELSANINTNTGAFNLLAPGNPTPQADYVVASRGSAFTGSTTARYAINSPDTSVVTLKADIAGDLVALRTNEVDRASGTGDQGTGNYGNYPLYIGARAGTSLWFNGRLYGMVVAGKLANAVEITETEKYVNGKTAAY